MPVGVAAVDANLLVPIAACDFLLTAFDRGVFEPIVSTTVLDEVERTLIEYFPHADPGGLRRRVEHMRAALADQTVDTKGLVAVAGAVNAKDRHIVAAALAAEATCLVTNDNALRSEVEGSGLDLEPLDGNDFVMRLWDASPAEVSEVIGALIAKRLRRPVSPTEMAAQLRVHFPAMTAAWLARRHDAPGSGADH